MKYIYIRKHAVALTAEACFQDSWVIQHQNVEPFWGLLKQEMMEVAVVSTHRVTHVHTVLTAIFTGEPRLAGCLFNSPPFIPELRILLGEA